MRNLEQHNRQVEIAIPTYNRPNEILKRCEELAPQLNEKVSLTIYDNNSSPPITEVLGSFAHHPFIKIVRNKMNIGADANILRCVEYASAEWVWILGDDDAVTENATETLTAILTELPNDVGVVKFSSPCGSVNKTSLLDISKRSIAELNFSFSSNFLFISSTVIRINTFNSLEQEYQAISSMASQIVLMLNILNEGYKILQTSEQLIKDASPPEWNWIDLEMQLIMASKYINHQNEDSFRFSRAVFSNVKIAPLMFLSRLSKERKSFPAAMSRKRFHHSLISRIGLSHNRPQTLLLEILAALIYFIRLDGALIIFAKMLKKIGLISSKKT